VLALSCAALVGIVAGVALHLLTAPQGSTAGGGGVATGLSGEGSTAGTGAVRTGLSGEASWRAGTRPAPAIRTLRDQTGHLFTLSSLRGHTVAMTFFDSRCTQACPLEGRALAAAEMSLPAAQRPVLVAVSVNPSDTPASARRAARSWGLAQAAGWHWLMGSHRQLARIWRAYHIAVAPPHDGDIAHTEALYLIDRRGDERAAFLYPFARRFVAADLRMLATEARS
jgi:cytochrome oxidase Cu insertion factor (SCO1/SenC/PrrC family)